jgi:hypothetical protein
MEGNAVPDAAALRSSRIPSEHIESESDTKHFGSVSRESLDRRTRLEDCQHVAPALPRLCHRFTRGEPDDDVTANHQTPRAVVVTGELCLREAVVFASSAPIELRDVGPGFATLVQKVDSRR